MKEEEIAGIKHSQSHWRILTLHLDPLDLTFPLYLLSSLFPSASPPAPAICYFSEITFIW